MGISPVIAHSATLPEFFTWISCAALFIVACIFVYTKCETHRYDMADIRREVLSLLSAPRDPANQHWNAEGTFVEFVYPLKGQVSKEPRHLAWIEYTINKKNGGFVLIRYVPSLSREDKRWLNRIAREFRANGWLADIAQSTTQPDFGVAANPGTVADIPMPTD